MSKQSFKKINILNSISIIVTFILIVLIILTPIIIKDGYSIFDEEVLEMMSITILILSIYLSHFFQKKYTQKLLSKINVIQHQKLKNEKQLTESFQYIGQVNVQIQEINKYFLENNTYPKTKGDLKKIISIFAEKILDIIPSSFVLIRFIQTEPVKTMTELSIKRGVGNPPHINIGNKTLIKSIDENSALSWITSTHENTTIKTYAIFDNCKITDQQKIFTRIILNDLEMIFIIYKSEYFKKK